MKELFLSFYKNELVFIIMAIVLAALYIGKISGDIFFVGFIIWALLHLGYFIGTLKNFSKTH